MRRTPLLVLVLALGGAPTRAHAAYLLESAPLTTRDAAEAELARISGALGAQAASARVVRRYVRGTGWRYFVSVEDLADQRTLAVAATAFAGGPPPMAWSVEGMDRRAVELAATPAAAATPASAAPPPAPPPSPPRAVAATPAPTRTAALSTATRAPTSDDKARARSALSVLRAAARAHGGPQGGAAVLDSAGAFTWRFTRTVVTDGGRIVARHDYARQGDAGRLDVRITEGEGTSSSSGITAGGKAWLRADGGELLDRDPQRIAEVLDRFDPRTVLEGILDLPQDIQTSAAWRGLERVGPADTPLVSLRPRLEPGMTRPAEGLVQASFDSKTHLLVELVWQRGGGVTRYRYADHSELVPGLVLPRRVEILHGETLVERLDVEGLEVSDPLPESAFEPPSG